MSAVRFCTSCGQPASEGRGFCTSCGVPVRAAAPVSGHGPLAAAPVTDVGVGAFVTRIGTWIRSHLVRTLFIGALGFGVSWAMNIWILGFRYDGYRCDPPCDPGNAIATAEGSGITGHLFWATVTMVVTGFITYAFTVGWRRALRDLFGLPGTIAGVVRSSGGRAISLIMWGAAMMLAVSMLIAPSMAGVAGLGLLLAAPTVLSGVIGRLVGTIWSLVLGVFAPRGGPVVPGFGGRIIGMVGAGAGMAIAFFATETPTQLITIGALVLGAFVFAAMPSRAAMATLVSTVAAGIGVWVLLRHGVALADDGGWAEFQGYLPDPSIWDWLTHPDTQQVITQAAGGAVAGGVGSIVGAGAGGAAGGVSTTVTPPPGGGGVVAGGQVSGGGPVGGGVQGGAAIPPGLPPAPVPTMVDPDTGQTLPIDGGEVWYGEWMSPDEAQKLIDSRIDEINLDQEAAAQHQQFVQQQQDIRREELQDLGFTFDPDSNTWRPGLDTLQKLDQQWQDKIAQDPDWQKQQQELQEIQDLINADKKQLLMGHQESLLKDYEYHAATAQAIGVIEDTLGATKYVADTAINWLGEIPGGPRYIKWAYNATTNTIEHGAGSGITTLIKDVICDKIGDRISFIDLDSGKVGVEISGKTSYYEWGLPDNVNVADDLPDWFKDTVTKFAGRPEELTGLDLFKVNADMQVKDLLDAGELLDLGLSKWKSENIGAVYDQVTGGSK